MIYPISLAAVDRVSVGVDSKASSIDQYSHFSIMLDAWIEEDMSRANIE
jgi:hypothetical protein